MSTKFGGPFLAFPRWVLPYLQGDSTAKSVLLQLLMYMNADTQTTTTSYNYIAEQVGVDRRTVMRAVTRLESTGVLIRRRRGTKGHNMTNAFIINFNNPAVLTAEDPEVVSPMTLGSVTHDTTRGDTHDTTPSDTSVTQIRTNNKSTKKSNHNKRPTEGYEDLKVGKLL